MHVSSLRLPEVPDARPGSDDDSSSLVDVTKDDEDSQPVFSPTSSQISHFSLLSSDVDINESVSSDAQYAQVCEQAETGFVEKEGPYSGYEESVASGPGESITGYRDEPRHSYSISQRLDSPKAETTPPAIVADHLAPHPVVGSSRSQVNIQPWLQSLSQYHLPTPGERGSAYISLSDVGKAEEKPGPLIVDELTHNTRSGIPSDAYSSIVIDTEDASVSVPHFTHSELSGLPDDQASFSTALEGLPATLDEPADDDSPLRSDADKEQESDSRHMADTREASHLEHELALPAASYQKQGAQTWRHTFGVPKPIVTIATVLTALSFVLDMIPKVVVPRIDYDTSTSVLATDVIISRPRQGPSLALDLGAHIAQATSASNKSSDSLSRIDTLDDPLYTTAIFLLLAFLSVYSVMRILLAKRASVASSPTDERAHSRQPTSKRKVRIRTVSPTFVSAPVSPAKIEDLHEALLTSRKRPSPSKAETREPSSPSALLRSAAKPVREVKKAIVKPISRSPSPALTETPTKQKLRATSLTPGSDRVTRSMTRARIVTATIEAGSPTVRASKAKSRKQAAVLSDSGTEQPGEELAAKEIDAEKAGSKVEKRSVSAPVGAGAGCTFHIVTVSGAAGSGKTALIMQQTQQRIPQTNREKQDFEKESQAHINLFEKGKQRNTLVYRRADRATEAWNLHNPDYSGRAADTWAGAQIKMVVYDVNDESSFTYAHEEALQYLQDSAAGDSLICLVANKCDLLPSDEMPQQTEQAKQISLHWLRARQVPPALSRERINWFAVSAATGEGVMPMFREIARNLRTPKKTEVEHMDIDKPVREVIVID